MIKHILTSAAAMTVGTLLLTSVAFAASNPAGTGQPGADCANQTAMPNGFTSSGFAHAESVYAGSDGTPSQTNAQSTNAVSQYDVACYQVSQ